MFLGMVFVACCLDSSFAVVDTCSACCYPGERLSSCLSSLFGGTGKFLRCLVEWLGLIARRRLAEVLLGFVKGLFGRECVFNLVFVLWLFTLIGGLDRCVFMRWHLSSRFDLCAMLGDFILPHASLMSGCKF